MKCNSTGYPVHYPMNRVGRLAFWVNTPLPGNPSIRQELKFLAKS
ncbi:MAG: hypothetical protein RIM23_01050 [Coleofasciculus sp. G3-WIS-01]